MGRRDPRCDSPGCTFQAVIDGTRCVQHGGVPPQRTSAVAPIDHMPKCGATRRDGGTCMQPPRRCGNRCWMHGGATPAVVAKNERTVMEASALEAARRFGLPRDISPLDALREELARTQGHVDWLADQIARHDTNPALLAVYQAERAHLMRITQQANSIGLEDRLRKLQERSLEALENAILATLDDLGVNADKGTSARSWRGDWSRFSA